MKKVTHTNDGTNTIIELRVRDLDVGAVAEIKTELESAIGKAPRLILDLEEVEFIDSSGAGLLVWLWRRLRASESELVICGLSQQVRVVLDSLNFSRLFTIAEDCNQGAGTDPVEGGRDSR